MESSVEAELLLLEEDVTDSRVLSPARLMVVDETVPLVWGSVWAIGGEASPCPRVVDGCSRGTLSVSVCITETACQDTAGGEPEACSVLTKAFHFLLLASVATPTAAVASGSVDPPRASKGLVLISVSGCVCSVPDEKEI